MSSPFLITEKTERVTNVTACLYPESAPVDWLDILKQTRLPFSVSPLHDKDINEDGTPKKPHYHILICWPGPTTGKKVCKLFRDILNQPYPEEAISVIGSFRYQIHRDNPEKYQYREEDRKCYNGFDASKYDKLTAEEELKLYIWLEKFIERYSITNYRLACVLLRETGHFYEYSFFSKHTMHFKEYIRSFKDSHSGMDSKQVCDYESVYIPEMVENILHDDFALEELKHKQMETPG